MMGLRCCGSKMHTDSTIVLCVGSTISDKVERKPVVGKEDIGYGCG